MAEAGREVNPDDLYGNLFLPNKGMIDGFTGDRPVLVQRFDRKVYLAVRRRMQQAGVRQGMPDPDGIIVERTDNGEPTGASRSTRYQVLSSQLSLFETTCVHCTATSSPNRPVNSAYRRRCAPGSK
ncbi:MAG: hypothetical protein U5K38_10380 [Woeseiaceae bacterium]|nr:hypothetical protein [Woeseiaceae bacterium]